MGNDLHDFKQFMKTREEAASAYVRGDAAPLGRIVTRESPATFFGSTRDYREGTEEVSSTYEHDAKLFEPGGDSHFEILQMAASDGIAYWVGFQRATARMRGKAEAVSVQPARDGNVPPRRWRVEDGPSARRFSEGRLGGR